MNCYICGDKENFHSFDTKENKLNELRELLCCKNCGSVCYRVEDDAEEKMKHYYRYDYRPSPNHMNMITTTHKLNYVKCFMRDFLNDKKDLIIGDVGAATGYLVNFFRKLGYKATGCEYTLTFRRFSENFYGIPITEELKTDIKYGLISIYHVLEHMVKPDEKLAYYASLLKEGGHMLISTPQWYDTLEEASGPNVTTFQNLWHKDHINVFSEETIKNLFKKTGLEIVKEDHFVYGQTYLLKYTGNKSPIQKENPDQKIKKTLDGYSAIEAYQKGQYRDAIKLWPKFPDAWLAQIMNQFAKDPERQKDLFEEVSKIMPQNKRIMNALMLWHFQYGRYDEVIKIGNYFMSVAPDEEKMMLLGQVHSLKEDHKSAMSYFYNASDMDPRKWIEAMDWICREACKLPTWDEKTLDKIKKDIEDQAKPGLKLVDPIFDKPLEENKNGSKKEDIKELEKISN